MNFYTIGISYVLIDVCFNIGFGGELLAGNKMRRGGREGEREKERPQRRKADGEPSGVECKSLQSWDTVLGKNSLQKRMSGFCVFPEHATKIKHHPISYKKLKQIPETLYAINLSIPKRDKDK